jgi:hypothetical protein
LADHRLLTIIPPDRKKTRAFRGILPEFGRPFEREDKLTPSRKVRKEELNNLAIFAALREII